MKIPKMYIMYIILQGEINFFFDVQKLIEILNLKIINCFLKMLL